MKGDPTTQRSSTLTIPKHTHTHTHSQTEKGKQGVRQTTNKLHNTPPVFVGARMCVVCDVVVRLCLFVGYF
jgi:hypothetical protein